MIKSLFASLFVFAAYCASAQMTEYQYSRPLSGIKDQWHSIVLPQEMYAHVAPSYADIRIVGITAKQDTIEAPYILRRIGEQLPKSKIPVLSKIINRSRKSNGSFFTLEVPDIELNSILLHFKQQNFDWKVKLEGSHDQKEWFTIVDDYRILSIHNDEADYTYSRLTFPDSKYRYFRLFVPGSQTADLLSAHFPAQKTVEGQSKEYPAFIAGLKDEKHSHQTVVDLELKAPVPVNSLKVYIQTRYDYFRPVTVEYVSDSFKTEQGWKYLYAQLCGGTLNSIDGNRLKFNSTLLKRLRITIENHDNQPLTIDSFAVSGPEYELIARFAEQAEYFLVYGNKNATEPSYDIVRFASNIPEDPARLNVGDETSLSHTNASQTAPLFQNKIWLWLIMGVIIVVIGWFSLSMMRKVEAK